ncbi:hypothetical protein TWF730_011088 [Orbilia blumenaviensis]|uniref:Uncharacterized protein n=1 Tax=Orbilia blumenaviensis TaxID=1796055 RepID=A0AAV9UKT9_9PEZI
MRYTKVQGSLLLLLSTATTTVTAASTTLRKCAADNCLRAIRASAFPDRPGTADCSSYFQTTVTPPSTYTTIQIVTPTILTSYEQTTTVPIPIATTDASIETPQTFIPSNIPTYASACSGSIRYSSACSCIGMTAKKTTLPAPTTTTLTVTDTASQTSKTTVAGTATVTSFLIAMPDIFEGGPYVKATPWEYDGESYITGFLTSDPLQATHFYLGPDGRLKSNGGEVGIYTGLEYPSKVYFDLSADIYGPMYCAIDDETKALACRSEFYEVFGAWTLAHGLDQSGLYFGAKGWDWERGSNDYGHLALKAVPPPGLV